MASAAVAAAEQETRRTGGRGRSEGSRRTQFKPGQSGNPKGRPMGIPGRQTNRLLRNCRRGFGQDRSKDATHAQRRLREFLDLLVRQEGQEMCDGR